MVDEYFRKAESISAQELCCKAISWDGNLQHEIIDDWKKLLSRLPAISLSYYPEWTALQCQYRITKPCQILLVKSGKIPLAVIPLRKGRFGSAAVEDRFCPVFPPVLIDPEAEKEVWGCISEWLRGKHGIPFLFLGRHADPRRMSLFSEAVKEHGAIPSLRQVMPNIIIPIRENWEEYLAGLGPRTRKGIRSMERYIGEESSEVSIEVITDPAAIEKVMEEFIAVHRRRWQHQASGSIFDNPRNAKFYRALLAWAVPESLAMLVVLRKAGQYVAAETVFHIPGQEQCEWHYIAHDKSIAFPKHFSSGVVLDTFTIHKFFEQGIKYICAGHGASNYKQQLGGEEHEQIELSIARSSLVSMLFPKIDTIFNHLQRIPKNLRFLLSRQQSK